MWLMNWAGRHYNIRRALLAGMAGVHRTQGRHNEALEFFGRALAVRRKAQGDEHVSVGDTMLHMAGVYKIQERFEAGVVHSSTFRLNVCTLL